MSCPRVAVSPLPFPIPVGVVIPFAKLANICRIEAVNVIYNSCTHRDVLLRERESSRFSLDTICWPVLISSPFGMMRIVAPCVRESCGIGRESGSRGHSGRGFFSRL